MRLPHAPVTLSVEEVAALHHKLAEIQHDLNNRLALLVAAVELIKVNPASLPQMSAALSAQPARISELVRRFGAEVDQALKIAPG
jgi:hypothetical protein